MDQEQFDQITRTLASGLSRRGMLRTLSAGACGRSSRGGRARERGGKRTVQISQRALRQGQDCAMLCLLRFLLGRPDRQRQVRSVQRGSQFLLYLGGCHWLRRWLLHRERRHNRDATFGPRHRYEWTGSSAVDHGINFESNASSGIDFSVLATMEGVCADSVPLTC